MRLLTDEMDRGDASSKNSGGDATYAKIEAARALGLGVRRHDRAAAQALLGHILTDVEQTVAWLHGLAPRGG